MAATDGRPYPSCGFLTQAERKLFLEEIASGKYKLEILLLLKRTMQVFKNTCWVDSEFARAIRETEASYIEEALVRLSTGKPAEFTRRTKTGKRGPDGQLMRDEAGNPVLEVSREDTIPIAQSAQAIQFYLNAHLPDVYNRPDGQPAENIAEESPEVLRARMLADLEPEPEPDRENNR